MKIGKYWLVYKKCIVKMPRVEKSIRYSRSLPDMFKSLDGEFLDRKDKTGKPKNILARPIFNEIGSYPTPEPCKGRTDKVRFLFRFPNGLGVVVDTAEYLINNNWYGFFFQTGDYFNFRLYIGQIREKAPSFWRFFFPKRVDYGELIAKIEEPLGLNNGIFESEGIMFGEISKRITSKI